jgi:hypothetical protein
MGLSKTTKIGITVALVGLAFHMLGKGEKTTVKERVQVTGEGSSLKGLGNLMLLVGGGVVAYELVKNNLK